VTHLVIDASVIVKWILPDRVGEAHTRQALEILDAIGTGAIRVHQPPHWLAEAAAVVARLDPSVAARAVRFLHAMELPVLDDPDVYERACALSTQLDHHLFDTLYHAVAQSWPDTTLVTADDHYYRKARSLGGIAHLRAYRPS